MTCAFHGTGRPIIAVGVLPHGNEPLGSAFVSTVGGYRGDLGTLALIGPIEPPPRAFHFPLPCDPVTFVSRGFLPPLREQAEFSHCQVPRTPAQRRAAECRSRVRGVAADALILLHNDPTALAPYLYANSPWPKVERRLRDEVGPDFPDWKPPSMSWTQRIGERTYAYFPSARIGVKGTECAGIYIQRELGIPTLTLELPMFDWGEAEPVRQHFRHVIGDWVAAGGAYGGDRSGLTRDLARLLAGRHVPMVPPELSSRVVWSALAGLRESLNL